jgi:uncharacterized protein YndB with AHSA1/START domain
MSPSRRNFLAAPLGLVWLNPVEALAQVTGTPGRFQMTMETRASRQAVFALWADPATWPRWDTMVERTTLTAPLRVGSRGKLKGASGPESNVEIVTLEPERRLVLAATGPGLRMTFERRFEAGEATRFTHAFAMTGAAAGFLTGRLGPRFQAAMPVSMQRLKALAEAAT